MTLYMLCALLLGLILGWLIWGRLAARLRQAEADRADLSSQLKQRGDGSDQKAQIDRLNNELDDCRRARVSQQAEIERLNREVGLAEERASMATAAPVAAAAAAAPLMSADEGTKPSTLTAARNGKPDDLKLIKGVGPKMERMLNGMGFYHFDQIADWTGSELAWVDDNLEGFKGRASRDEWVPQARILASRWVPFSLLFSELLREPNRNRLHPAIAEIVSTKQFGQPRMTAMVADNRQPCVFPNLDTQLYIRTKLDGES